MKKLLLLLLVASPTLLFSQCLISYHTLTVGSCDPASNNFDLNGEIQFTNPPATGQLIVEDCNGNQAVYNAPFTSPLMYTISNIPSDGTINCSVNAYFTANPSCSLASPAYDNPINCQCSSTIGTFTDNLTGGTYLVDPWYLCYGDNLNITADGNYVPASDQSTYFPSISYDPGLWLLVYDCPPTVGPPNDINTDTCLVGIASTVNGVWDILNNVGDGSTYWYMPITMYSMSDGIYAISINGGEWCYDAAPAYEVINLAEITTTEVLDIGAGTITVTASGGMPAYNGSVFTISNVIPATATVSQSTVMHDSTFVISNVQSGQFYQYILTDTAGCSVVFGAPDPFVGMDELTLDDLQIYPNPSTGEFIVKSSLEGELIVRDLAGRFITEGKLNQTIDIREYPEGMYLVYIKDKVFKVTLQK